MMTEDTHPSQQTHPHRSSAVPLHSSALSDDAQADRGAVEAAVRRYVDGCVAADAAAVADAFSPDAVMWGHLAGQYVTMSGTDFAQTVVAEADPAGPEYSHRIHSIDVTGDIASAVLDERQFLGLDFHNQFGLVRRDGCWRINSKVFTSL